MRWAETHADRTPDPAAAPRGKFYCLDFFPYPSGAGLSVGHARNYIPTDVVSRLKRRQGYAVLHPMGWDAFGLPAENEAISRGIHPADSIAAYTATYRRQMTRLGCSYDWEREIWSCAPAYYRWTQWIFLRLVERGLAYRAAAPVNWCATCQTVLANEEVEQGTCWRCHQPVASQVRAQWFFRITAYADRLRADLEPLDWPTHIKTLQRNWIDGLRDWLISRQRYWGVPIPIVHCPRCGLVPVPDAALPVRLPPIDDYRPHGDGQSPLANVAAFVDTVCPTCGGAARRETDTMGGFACSSWYFLRFANPGYDDGPFDPAAVAAWLPVDLYVGGAEHAVSHLLYARFWTKALYDLGLIAFDEPFPRLRSQGVLHAPDGKRMSKSRRNIVSPDTVIDAHGADALRLHTLFMAPFDEPTTWQADGIAGVERFLARVWAMGCRAAADDRPPTTDHQGDHRPPTTDHQGDDRPPTTDHGSVAGRRAWPEVAEGLKVEGDGREPATPLAVVRGRSSVVTPETATLIRRVTESVESFRFNTAVAALMEHSRRLAAQAEEPPPGWRDEVKTFIAVLAPFAPFIAEELWARLGHTTSVHAEPWPEAGESEVVATVEMAVQINGKVVARVTVAADADAATAREAALAAPGVAAALQGREPRRVIVVPGRLVNVVV